MKDKENNRFKYKCENGLLSSLIVSYNSGEYLFEAIDSVLEQSYEKIELIISDDGSKKFDEKAVYSYIESKKRENLVRTLITHREKNIGTVRNINLALEILRGEFIKILGADDTYYSNDVFKKQVDYISSHSAIACVGKSQQCDHHMNPIFDERVDRSNKGLPIVLNMDYRSARKYITKKDIFPIAIQAVCYHRKFFEKNGFCDEDYVLIDDAASALMLLKEAKKVVYCDDFTVNHRARVGISSSKELFAARRLQYYKDCVTFAKKEIDGYPDIYNFIYRKENIRINQFVFLMAKMKVEGRGNLNKICLVLKYIDAILYYIFSNPRKFAKRIAERFLK